VVNEFLVWLSIIRHNFASSDSFKYTHTDNRTNKTHQGVLYSDEIYMCSTECRHKSNGDTCMAYIQCGASYAVGESYDLPLHTHIYHSGKVSHL
jgi:hypothetical protein